MECINWYKDIAKATNLRTKLPNTYYFGPKKTHTRVRNVNNWHTLNTRIYATYQGKCGEL